VSTILLSEYAFFLKPGGRIYTITDVEELHNWHVSKLDAHPLFRRVDLNQDGQEQDPAVNLMISETEESFSKSLMGERRLAMAS
jgi:tRNA G46 methylase TrmB